MKNGLSLRAQTRFPQPATAYRSQLITQLTRLNYRTRTSLSSYNGPNGSGHARSGSCTQAIFSEHLQIFCRSQLFSLLYRILFLKFPAIAELHSSVRTPVLEDEEEQSTSSLPARKFGKPSDPAENHQRTRQTSVALSAALSVRLHRPKLTYL